MRQAKPNLQIEAVPPESTGAESAIWSDSRVKRAAFHLGHTVGFDRGFKAREPRVRAPEVLVKPPKIIAADLDVKSAAEPAVVHSTNWAADNGHVIRDSVPAERPRTEPGHMKPWYGSELGVTSDAFHKEALDPQEPYPGKGADLVLGAKQGPHARVSPRDHWTGALATGATPAADLDLKHGHGPNHYSEDGIFAQYGDSTSSKRDPYAGNVGAVSQPTEDIPQSPYYADEFRAAHKRPSIVVTGPSSDEDKKMAIKRVKDDDKDGRTPGNETDTGDAGGKEQAEAKRGDEAEQRRDHNSQHTPSTSKEGSDLKAQEDPTQKTETDKDTKPPIVNRPTPTVQQIPEGKVGGDGFQPRPPGQGHLDPRTQMGEQPFRLMSDVGVKEGERAALHSDDQNKLEAVRQAAMREGFMHGHSFAKGGQMPEYMRGHFQEPVVHKETIVAAGPAPKEMRDPGAWLHDLADEIGAGMGHGHGPGHHEAADMDFYTSRGPHGPNPTTNTHDANYQTLDDVHSVNHHPYTPHVNAQNAPEGTARGVGEGALRGLTLGASDFLRAHDLDMGSPLTRAQSPAGTGDHVDAAMRRVASRRGY